MPSDAFLNWGYAFQSPAWKTAGIEHVLLTKVSVWVLIDDGGIVGPSLVDDPQGTYPFLL
jgi:hypothetical protein